MTYSVSKVWYHSPHMHIYIYIYIYLYILIETNNYIYNIVFKGVVYPYLQPRLFHKIEAGMHTQQLDLSATLSPFS